MTPLHTLLKQRVLVLDGAMGTMLIARGYTRGCNDLLCLEAPAVVEDIHRRYLAAGADIIETNTFNAQRISLADYDATERVRDINLAAARMARRLADEQTRLTPSRPRFVAGSVGPTSKTLSMSPDVEDPALRTITFDALCDAYVEQMTALIEGGVDVLLIETIFDTLNAKAALCAATHAMHAVGRTVPIMLSLTVTDRAGRTLSGQTIDAFLTSVAHADLLSVGLNCSFGAADMLAPLRQMSAQAPYFISAYPNAGLPNALGQYDESPTTMLAHMRRFTDERLVNIIGGCCGTTDDHIRLLATLADQARPHEPVAVAPTLRLAGLERLELTPELAFVNVGERCNVAGSRKFLRLIREHDYDAALAIARQQVEDGALVIDINMDDGLLDAASEMTHFLDLIAAEPEIARVPVMIDSSEWGVISQALRHVQGKAIVNSISLKEGEATFIAHARELRAMGAAAVVMAFDEQGQATTYERRTAVCRRAYDLLTRVVGMPAADIIFDPNVLTVATGMPQHDAYALDFIRATRWIRTHLPGAHVSGGISNLSFAFRGNNDLREAMHAVFLYHARRAGLDMAILNPATRVAYSDIPAPLLEALEDVVLCRRPDATERLIAMQAAPAAQATTTPPTVPGAFPPGLGAFPPGLGAFPPGHDTADAASTPEASVATCLITALRRGTTDTLEADLEAALAAYPSPVAIIEGPLMEGMNLVGQLFGEGKMFLPQVVKTARTMKRAVEILQPHINAAATGPAAPDTPSPASRPRVLLATVKGDVHDIGKNIVAVVMACNGYDVIDLGVMVPAETIVEKTLELQPDVIGLSGLITPSLGEMVATVRLLDQAGIHVPVLIGGATTSPLHTALKIAPAYAGPVIHVRDASQNVPLAAPFLNAATADEAAAELLRRQETLRSAATTPPGAELLTIEEARRRKPNFFHHDSNQP